MGCESRARISVSTPVYAAFKNTLPEKEMVQWMEWKTSRGRSPPPSLLFPLEKALRQGVDLGEADPGDGVDAGLDLGERAEGLPRQHRRVLAHGLSEGITRHDLMHEAEILRL